MRTHALAVVLLLATAPLAVGAPAWAQAGAEDPTTAMARARFKEGVDYYDKGEYEQARASFLQAYALKKHPAVLLNLAWSCVKSGHALEAERYFKQFLVESKDITEKQRADANDGLTQSRARLGRIEITASAGTDIMIDGDRVGTAPLGDSVSVEAGAHTIKFKAPDGSVETQSVTVLGGEKAIARLRASAAPAPAAPVPTPAATPAPPVASSPPPVVAEEPPKRRADHAAARETPTSDTGKGLFSAPKSTAPLVLFGTVAVAGYAAAVTLYFMKNSAQDKATQIAADIVTNGGGSGTCTTPSPKYAKACDAFVTDNNDVNTDALIGNIALAVGVAATAGLLVYWLAADKRDDTSASAAPVVAPMVGPSVGGLSFSGRF